MPDPSIYGWITILGILVGAILWHRRWRHGDPVLFGIFIGGIIAAFIGAKFIYFLAEGWTYIGKPDFWWQLGYGKTITGALLGGYAGVEVTKKMIGYDKATGDWFAFMVPLAIAFGRIGCLKHGCCLGRRCDPTAWYASLDQDGVSRWPAAPTELIFNLLLLPLLFQLRRSPELQGQLFHIYLVAYGSFRFFHEFARETSKVICNSISGYQVAALALVTLGAWRFHQRLRSRQAENQIAKTQ